MECGGILDLHGYYMRYDTKLPMIGSIRNYLAGYVLNMRALFWGMSKSGERDRLDLRA